MATHTFNVLLLSSLACVSALALMGCDDSSSSTTPPAPPVRQGDIGAVSFTYQCAGAGDEQCNVDADLAPASSVSNFPLIAVGSTFGLQAAWASGAGTGPITLAATDPDFMTVGQGGDVTAMMPGFSTLIASGNGAVVDITTLEMRAVDHLQILQASPQGDFKDGTVQIGPGGLTAQANVQFTFKFRVIPTAIDGSILAGQFPIAWTSSDDSIVKLSSAGNDNIATFVSGNSGQATVHVTCGTLSSDVAIKVGS